MCHNKKTMIDWHPEDQLVHCIRNIMYIQVIMTTLSVWRAGPECKHLTLRYTAQPSTCVQWRVFVWGQVPVQLVIRPETRSHLNMYVIYAVFSIYWGGWTFQVLDVSIEKGVGYWIIIVLKKSKFITLYITWERWTLLTSIIAEKGIMKISIILGMIWLLYFSSPEIAEKR